MIRRPPRSTLFPTRRSSDLTLELHLVQGNLHSQGLLMAYLPRERLLIQADAFHPRPGAAPLRSEEHTSELQSRLHLVCRLLLEKKNNTSWPLRTFLLDTDTH